MDFYKINKIFCITILCLGLNINAHAQDQNNDPSWFKGLSMHILDVGAGLSIILKIPRSPDENDSDQRPFSYIIYDLGNKSSAIEDIQKIIPKHSEIDLLVLSHTDADHIGNLSKLIDPNQGNYKIHSILRAGFTKRESKIFNQYIKQYNLIESKIKQLQNDDDRPIENMNQLFIELKKLDKFSSNVSPSLTWNRMNNLITNHMPATLDFNVSALGYHFHSHKDLTCSLLNNDKTLEEKLLTTSKHFLQTKYYHHLIQKNLIPADTFFLASKITPQDLICSQDLDVMKVLNQEFKFGDAKIKILAAFPFPEYNSTLSSAKSVNGVSIVLQVEYADKFILLTGDTVGRYPGKENEKPILGESFMLKHFKNELAKTNFWLLSHHGGDDGSSKKLIETMRDSLEVGFVSAGHKHRHPHESAMNRVYNIMNTLSQFENNTFPIYRTDRNDKESPLAQNPGSHQREHTGGFLSKPLGKDPSGDDPIWLGITESGVAHHAYSFQIPAIEPLPIKQR